MKKISLLLSLILLPALLLSACGNNSANGAATPTTTAASDTVIAEGHLVPAQNQTMTFQARGKVAEIPVKKGDKVAQNQVLVSLADREQAQAALAAAELGLTSAQQDLDKLNRTAGLSLAQAWQAYMDAQKVRQQAQLAFDKLDQSAIQKNIDDAQSDVTSRKTDLDNAQTDFDKYSGLSIDNSTRKSYEAALRTAQTNYDQAVQKWETLINDRDRVHAALNAAVAAEAEAQRTMQNWSSYPAQNIKGPDQVALAQAALDNAKAQVAAAQKALDNYDLKAPFNGTVMDINVSLNQLVGPETWAVIVADTSAWYVDTSDLNELDVVKVKIGQKVAVTADALPGVAMTGVVEEIARTPVNQGTDVLYKLHIRLDNPDSRLRWGMTMEVTLKANQ